jgi:hypothetical protein
MRLNSNEISVLRGILADIRRLSSLDWQGDGIGRDRLGAWRVRIDAAKRGIVPLDLSGWLGRQPTASDCVTFCRIYARLEAKGLIERHGHGRTSHVSLTAAGERIAKEHIGPATSGKKSNAPSGQKMRKK